MGQDNRVKELEEKIVRLQQELKHSRNNTYVGNTHTLHCTDGELYIYYGDDDQTLVMEVNQLFRDLPSIISMVTKEQKKQQEMHLKMIVKATTEL
jgi:hypothetical protein